MGGREGRIREEDWAGGGGGGGVATKESKGVLEELEKGRKEEIGRVVGLDDVLDDVLGDGLDVLEVERTWRSGRVAVPR